MSERILIVDDDEVVCENLRLPLEREGYQVESALKGEDAIECLRRAKYDLIFVDIRLEGRVTGIDVIKAASAIVERPKIAVISATLSKDLKPVFDKQGLSRTIDRVLQKQTDLQPDIFAGVVKEILKGSK